MKAILTRLFNHEELTSEETKQILLNITKEMYPEAQIAALLTAFPVSYTHLTLPTTERV